MSRETPNTYHASFIRKSLAAVSKIGHANPVLVPATASMRKPVLQSHRIFNLSLSRLKTSSPPRLGQKTRHGPHKHTPVDPDGSTSFDEDDSMYNEQDSLETDNSATDMFASLGHRLPPTARASLVPPGLNPRSPRYPIIVPMKKNVVPRPGAEPPSYWAPGGGCDVVRIEPEPTMRFQPRPGCNPPPFWNPGGRATRIDKPVYDSDDSPVSSDGEPSLIQDDTDTTISTSISSASGNYATEEKDEEASKSHKDHIHTQLEHILEMDDALIDGTDLPGVPQSVWATCPTPPPSPKSRSALRLTRKDSHALLNYLLLECGYDLGSLRRLEARFPVPSPEPEPEDVPEVVEEHAPDVPEVVEEYSSEVAELGTENPADDGLQIPNEGKPKDVHQEMPPTQQVSEERDAFVVPLETMASVLEEILQTLDTESMEGCETAELGTLATVEYSPPGPAPEVATRHDPETTAPRVERTIEGLNLKPSQSVSRSNDPFEYYRASAAQEFHGPPLYCPPLTRSRSLPECWAMSAFTVFANPPLPPSLTPAPAQLKPKAKMYLHTGAMITSVESLAPPLQSGRAYLRANMPSMKCKVKTRPNNADVGLETPTVMQGVPLTRTYTGKSLLKKPSLLSRLTKRDRAAVEPQPPKLPNKWVKRLAKMPKQTAERMRVLVKGAPNVREMPWKDFLKIMKDLGFWWDEMDGNAVKFHPPEPNDPAITFHRPHQKVCRMGELGNMRKRLADTYGWTPEAIIAAFGPD